MLTLNNSNITNKFISRQNGSQKSLIQNKEFMRDSNRDVRHAKELLRMMILRTNRSPLEKICVNIKGDEDVPEFEEDDDLEYFLEDEDKVFFEGDEANIVIL